MSPDAAARTGVAGPAGDRVAIGERRNHPRERAFLFFVATMALFDSAMDDEALLAERAAMPQWRSHTLYTHTYTYICRGGRKGHGPRRGQGPWELCRDLLRSVARAPLHAASLPRPPAMLTS